MMVGKPLMLYCWPREGCASASTAATLTMPFNAVAAFSLCYSLKDVSTVVVRRWR